MAIYLVSGKLGAGKTLSSVGRIRDVLLEKRRVATNLDLRLDRLLPPTAGRPGRSDTGAVHQPTSVIRLPDKPTVDDLEILGMGNDSMDESRNGLIVLDELAAWLNSRTWADKGRQAVIDWLIHSRKKGWDVMFICQHIDQIDKQIRTALVEFLVVCRRMDRMRIPFVGGMMKTLSGGLISGNLPKIHMAVVRYGTQPDAIIADRWLFKGVELYDAYNTRQVFTDQRESGPYSYLPPWHLGGHAYQSFMDRLRAWWEGSESPRAASALPGPKHRLVELLLQLPEDQRVKHWRRLEQLGAFCT